MTRGLKVVVVGFVLVALLFLWAQVTLMDMAARP